MKIVRFILLVVSSFAFTVLPVAEVKLKYQFKVGDQYIWSQDTRQKIKQNVMSMEQNTENIYLSEFLVKVVELTASGAKLETSFTKLKNESKNPMGNNSMDSEGPAEKMETKIFQSIINKPFSVFISSTGNVEKIEGADNLWSGFNELGMEEQQKKVIQESLQMMLGEESLKSSLQSAFVTYPDKKVKEGDKWTVSHNVVAMFAMAIENIWSLESVVSGVANLYAEGSYTTTDKEKTLSLPGGMKAKSDLNGKQAVKSAIDTKTGWPTKQQVLVELKGTMTLLAGGMIPQDMEIPMEIVSETTYIIVKK
jgi:hypothetical protein